jgi:8-oxo-dGTP pyrophosphatase MutT (NUDIX family)/nucleoside 2-deoxyribosyltransferase
MNVSHKKYHPNLVASYLVLKNENRILLLKRKNTGYEDGHYSVIAGHLEPGESFTSTVIREAKEEADITITQKDIAQTFVQHRKTSNGEPERVDTYFVATNWQGTVENVEPHKCEHLQWFDLNNLPENVVPCVRAALHSIKNQENYNEFGWTKDKQAKQKTITICGSMKFAEQMISLATQLKKNNWNVLLPDISQSKSQKSKSKIEYINAHFDKIKKSDAILVANYEKNSIPGYIGSNTLMEIGVAQALHKKIFILKQIGEQKCKEEVLSITTKILNDTVDSFTPEILLAQTKTS